MKSARDILKIVHNPRALGVSIKVFEQKAFNEETPLHQAPELPLWKWALLEEGRVHCNFSEYESLWGLLERLPDSLEEARKELKKHKG